MKKRSNLIRYWVTRSDDKHDLCPICDSKLEGCHIGEFCVNNSCRWCDGSAILSPKQVIELQKRGIRVRPFLYK